MVELALMSWKDAPAEYGRILERVQAALGPERRSMSWRLQELRKTIVNRGSQPIIVEGILLGDTLGHIGVSANLLIFVTDERAEEYYAGNVLVGPLCEVAEYLAAGAETVRTSI